ncbi:hypothetical protein L6V77_13360 [Myxococcota bacterium]|nr:hypothetical protein [Myxococcota bacterium]
MSSSLAEAALAGVEGDPKRQVARAEALWETVGRALEPHLAPTNCRPLSVAELPAFPPLLAAARAAGARLAPDYQAIPHLQLEGESP